MKKVTLLDRVSALEYLPNLSNKLGPRIFIKRDDEGGRGGGGNKLRKYERIIGAALEEKCDTLIIAGHFQSNAARELVAAARQLGLFPIVVCKEMIPKQNEIFNQTGNALLMSLMKAEIVAVDKDADFNLEMNKVAKRVRKNGRNPYIIPFGGSNYLGALGYVDCAKEIVDQCKERGMNPPSHVFVPTGSGGTHAGLVAGFSIEGVKTSVIGISVLHKKQEAEKIVSRLTTEVLDKARIGQHQALEIVVDDHFIGDGYGIPTKRGIDAIRLLAELEALFLCPVYTAKAMSGLVDYIGGGTITKNDCIVFIHTGGVPLIYPYFDKLF